LSLLTQGKLRLLHGGNSGLADVIAAAMDMFMPKGGR
jgi:hypothetical protein